MTDPKASSEVTGTVGMLQQTETSPLKQGDTKRNWCLKLFWNPVSDQDQGSLKVIVLNFFGFTVIVTIALLVQIYYGKNGNEPHGSVASDSYECSKIGVDILKKGGNSVDAAIAATMCLGVDNFHTTGLGGGGYMMIYNHKSLEVMDVLDFQATVPSSLAYTQINTAVEGLTVGVPGLLMGLWEAHKKFGKLPWNELIMPSYNLAKYGFKIKKNIISAFSHVNLNSNNNKNLKEFLNSLVEGKNITFPELASTLDVIASTGIKAFYNGSLAMDIVYSVKAANGNISLKDLSQYQISHSELLQTKFGKYNVLASGSSSGGSLLLNALDNIQFLDLTADDDVSSIILKMSDVLHDSYVAFLEKHDAQPSKQDLVASQVLVTDADDLYVAVVTGLNTWFGSQILTESGFILNNVVANGGINHEGRPFSLATPIIVVESEEICGRRLLLGTGDAIIGSQVLANALLFNNNVSVSVESPRFFVENIPRHISIEGEHEPNFEPATIKTLSSLLKIERIPAPYKSINAIEKIDDDITAHSDSRGGGLPLKFR